MKLIKLKEDHYVVVDDSEITQACYVYKSHENIHGRGIFFLPADTDFVAFNKEAKDVSVITHSTQPMPHGSVREGQVTGITAISLQEVKELIGEVDVQKQEIILTDDQKELLNIGNVSYKDSSIIYYLPYIFINENSKWYMQLKDNKEKKYTEEQMRECWRASERFDRPYNEGYAPNLEEFIQSLQSKTSWEVQIVDGKLKLKL